MNSFEYNSNTDMNPNAVKIITRLRGPVMKKVPVTKQSPSPIQDKKKPLYQRANSESSEIIEIMTRKTISTKNVRRIPGYFPLSHQPRKVSLVGRVIFNNTPKEDLLQSVNK